MLFARDGSEVRASPRAGQGSRWVLACTTRAGSRTSGMPARSACTLASSYICDDHWTPIQADLHVSVSAEALDARPFHPGRNSCVPQQSPRYSKAFSRHHSAVRVDGGSQLAPPLRHATSFCSPALAATTMARPLTFGHVIRQPAVARHTATVFLLHGLGDTGDGWAPGKSVTAWSFSELMHH